MSDLATLYRASAHDLPMVATGSVQSVITSPPYFGLRKYDGEQEIDWPAVSYSPMAGLPPLEIPAQRAALGNESTLEAYIAHLILCAREWRRCLHDTGTLFVNLGDSYASSGNGGNGQHGYKDGRTNRDKRYTAGKQNVPAKNLLMVPARYALAMQADGWILRSELIWHKRSPMPESMTDRPTKAHEMIYVFAKQERYFWNYDAVKERAVSGANGSRFDKGKTVAAAEQLRPVGKPERVESGWRNMRSVITLSSEQYPAAHFATMPSKLAEIMVKAGSRPGDTVLDPFSGSGTTGRAAIKLGRKYIGIDLAAEYLDTLAPERLTVQMEMM